MNMGEQHESDTRERGAYHNVGATDRRLSLAASAALAAFGLRRRGVAGAVAGALSTWLGYRGATGHCPVYTRLGRSSTRPGERGVFQSKGEASITTGVTIDRSPEDLYGVWRDFTRLPTFMKYIREVRTADEGRTHWVAEGPMGVRVEWDAEVTEDVPSERIAWRSVQDADIHQAGEIRFRPAPEGRGTEVELSMTHEAPAGAAPTRAVSALLGVLTREAAREDLKRFKRLMESGEIPTNATAASREEAA